MQHHKLIYRMKVIQFLTCLDNAMGVFQERSTQVANAADHYTNSTAADGSLQIHNCTLFIADTAAAEQWRHILVVTSVDFDMITTAAVTTACIEGPVHILTCTLYSRSYTSNPAPRYDLKLQIHYYLGKTCRHIKAIMSSSGCEQSQEHRSDTCSANYCSLVLDPCANRGAITHVRWPFGMLMWWHISMHLDEADKTASHISVPVLQVSRQIDIVICMQVSSFSMSICELR